ncbi:MAG: Nif3-like dinuclear metal center hexameric protein [Deltaproteobacteria bacterium]|nr:MAG: Nif3-like dinuclear metal center hexameric protein [Deltaproteobacteria bacterium]
MSETRKCTHRVHFFCGRSPVTEESRCPAVKDLLSFFDEVFPFDLAADWDNVGLLVGREKKEVSSILVTLDVVPETVEEARSLGVDLIVSHHPLFVEPQKKISDANPKTEVLLNLASDGIALISLHTNADLSPRGVSFWLAQELGAQEVAPLKETSFEKEFKVVVFTPQDAVPDVLKAAFDAGAGWIGNYSRCSFRAPGTGTFFPEEGANPRVGERGIYQEVAEDRVEVVVPEKNLSAVLASISSAHPYETPAVDVYPLRGKAARGWLGVLFEVDPPASFSSYLGFIQERLSPGILRYAGDPGRVIRKVALLGGSGGSFVDEVARSDADLYVSGDLKYHQVQLLVEAGKCVADVGHYDSEKFFVPRVGQMIGERFPRVTVHFSRRRTDPFALYGEERDTAK